MALLTRAQPYACSHFFGKTGHKRRHGRRNVGLPIQLLTRRLAYASGES